MVKIILGTFILFTCAVNAAIPGTPETPWAGGVKYHNVGTNISFLWYKKTGSTYYLFNGVNIGNNLNHTVSYNSSGWYGHQVQACNAEGCSAKSGQRNIYVFGSPGGVKNLSPISITVEVNQSFSFSWSAAGGMIPLANGSYYRVQKNGSILQSGSSTSYSGSESQSGSYTYIVQACNSSSTCGGYRTVSVTVKSPVPSKPSKPGTPWAGGKTYYAKNETISLTWSAQSGATYYKVNGVNVGNTTSKNYSYGTSNWYGFRVEACNSGGCSDPSNSRNVYVYGSPGGVKDLTPTIINVKTDEVFSFSWTAAGGMIPLSNGSYYRVHKGGPILQSGSSTSYRGSESQPGTYTYIVQACNSASTCGGYRTVEVTVNPKAPGVPINLTSTSALISDGGEYYHKVNETLELTWQTSDELAKYYEVYKVGTVEPIATPTTANVTLGLGLGSITGSEEQRSYSVKACNDANECGEPITINLTIYDPSKVRYLGCAMYSGEEKTEQCTSVLSTGLNAQLPIKFIDSEYLLNQVDVTNLDTVDLSSVNLNDRSLLTFKDSKDIAGELRKARISLKATSKITINNLIFSHENPLLKGCVVTAGLHRDCTKDDESAMIDNRIDYSDFNANSDSLVILEGIGNTTILTLSDNKFNGSPLGLVSLDNFSGGNITGNEFYRSGQSGLAKIQEDNGTRYFRANGTALGFDKASNFDITNNTFKYVRMGIWIDGGSTKPVSSNTQILNNRFYFGAFKFVKPDVNDPTNKPEYPSYNYGSAVYLPQTTNINDFTIQNNLIFNPTVNGMRINGDMHTVSNNYIFGAGDVYVNANSDGTFDVDLNRYSLGIDFNNLHNELIALTGLSCGESLPPASASDFRASFGIKSHMLTNTAISENYICDASTGIHLEPGIYSSEVIEGTSLTGNKIFRALNGISTANKTHESFIGALNIFDNKIIDFQAYGLNLNFQDITNQCVFVDNNELESAEAGATYFMNIVRANNSNIRNNRFTGSSERYFRLYRVLNSYIHNQAALGDVTAKHIFELDEGDNDDGHTETYLFENNVGYTNAEFYERKLNLSNDYYRDETPEGFEYMDSIETCTVSVN